MAAPTSVEDYLAALPEESRTALERLRKTIKAAVPEATETISYQMPALPTWVIYPAASSGHWSRDRTTA